ncbi:MAG: chorismate synthase, partial [Candidatus Cloacimonetes bacterium]|nr:chorismate synthase [Candidatus Cloacimonadota bacterium]
SIVEMIITNVSSGLGDPVFEKLDANIAKALLSIGGIKGIEFGEGFRLGSMTGSRANDQIDSTGYLSNHAGGITGGISTGQDIILRYVIKPPASIRQPQHTINHHGDDIVFTNKGRFDTWLAPRIIPVAEAMVKLVLADAISYQKLLTGCNPNLSDLREAVDKIDEDILIALYRRREFAKRIGLLKKENGLPIKDDTRESAIIKELISKADTWGLDPELVKKLWDIILDFSRKQQ